MTVSTIVTSVCIRYTSINAINTARSLFRIRVVMVTGIPTLVTLIFAYTILTFRWMIPRTSGCV